MSIFIKKIDDITIDDIENFIKEKHTENIRLEYKQDFSSTDTNAQIAKEVSAFANQQGGVILFGVSEGTNRYPDKIAGIDKAKEPRKKIQSVCIDHIYTPIFPEIQECELKGNPNKVVAIVRVAMSEETPHTINNRTGFYIRGEDICVPRKMTDEEIELLRGRRKELIDRRNWFLRRTEERVFSHATRNTLTKPLILTGIPLFPAKPLILKEKLYEVHRSIQLQGSRGFPLFSERVKTAGESVYCFLPHKEEGQSAKQVAKKRHGEINVFGQVSFYKSAIERHSVTRIDEENSVGIFLGLILNRVYFMIRYLGKFYEQLGYWGIVKFMLEIKNCRGSKVFTPHLRWGIEDLGEVELDENIQIDREYSVAQLLQSYDKYTADIIQELIWHCGVSANRPEGHNALYWVEDLKQSLYGRKECPQCKKYYVSNIDELCLKCRTE